MAELNFVTVKELYIGDLAQNGEWVVGCVRSAVPWPLKSVTATFRNRSLYLLPVATVPDYQLVNHPAVAVRLEPGERFRDGQVLISHFVSSLAWAKGGAIEVVQWSGGNLPRSMGGYSGGTMMTEEFQARYLPDPSDRDARLALGFYREGLYLNHVAYQCLSYFKILNIFLRTGAAQIVWINANVTKVTDHDARNRVAQLGAEPGAFLYGSNRCAVAHAGGAPTADPESPEDMAQLREDLPLVRALAEVAIEEQFGVKSSRTIWREHLYELEGFRELLGLETVRTIKDAGTMPRADWPHLPRLSIRLADRDNYAPMENMDTRVVGVEEGVVLLECHGNDGRTVIMLGLDLKEERLRLDAEQGITARDDNTAESARSCSRVLQFRRDYFLNGELEIWDTSRSHLLGRCDPFVPFNVDMNATLANFRDAIAAIETLAEERHDGERGLIRPQPFQNE